jgi:hypothetical protein
MSVPQPPHAVPAADTGLVVVAAAVRPGSAGVRALVVGQPTSCPHLLLTPALELAGGRIQFVGDWQLTDLRTGLAVGWPEPDPSWLLELADTAHHLRCDRSRGHVGPATSTGGAA